MNFSPNGWQLKFKQRGKNEQLIIGEIKMFFSINKENINMTKIIKQKGVKHDL